MRGYVKIPVEINGGVLLDTREEGSDVIYFY